MKDLQRKILKLFEESLRCFNIFGVLYIYYEISVDSKNQNKLQN